MSTDYGEKEREFLASLKDDTSRDLAEWMEAIAAQNLTHRNDIIDWLRRQGFMFSKASWLERIHHNGGKPIYGDKAQARSRAMPRSESEQSPKSPVALVAAPSKPPTDAARVESLEEPSRDPAPLENLLAKAKAYRPLAQFLLREVGKAVPGAQFKPEAAHVSIAREQEFAVLALSPRELRLGLDLGKRPFDALLEGAKFTNPAARISPHITHMVVLTDARQVNEALLGLVKEAAGRAAGHE
jgi:hypothetical protein